MLIVNHHARAIPLFLVDQSSIHVSPAVLIRRSKLEKSFRLILSRKQFGKQEIQRTELLTCLACRDVLRSSDLVRFVNYYTGDKFTLDQSTEKLNIVGESAGQQLHLVEPVHRSRIMRVAQSLGE